MHTSDEKNNEGKNIVQVGQNQFVVNHKGYLINFADWTKDFAKAVAETDHLELTKCHWETINFLREYYLEYKVPPHYRDVIKAVGEKINALGCSKKDLEKAFPLGGCKHACRLAGLPSHYCHAC